ncbi:hypothetical protein BH10PSE18_BH10PSE18_08220 [soil metagenome]
MINIRWKPNCNPDLILKKMQDSRVINEDGSGITFKGFALSANRHILETLLIYPDSLDDVDISESIYAALLKTPQLSKDSVLSEIKKTIKIALAKPTVDFNVLTSISVHPNKLPQSITIQGCRILFTGYQYPRKFRSRENPEVASRLPQIVQPRDYTRVVIKASAKTARGAMARAMKSIDIFRGIFNLQVNTHLEIFSTTRNWTPLNKVRLGPLHTIHKTSGEIEIGTLWYEPIFERQDVWNKDSKLILRNMRFFFRAIRGTSANTKLVGSLIRFARALDEKDNNVAFIKLWSALESLTSPAGVNEDTVRRCAVIYSDAEYHRQVMEHLRNYRNHSVHVGDPTENPRPHCMTLQNYFREIFWFYVKTAREFNDIAEANAFLDLPTNMEYLLRRQKLLKKAIAFFSPAE